MGEGVGRNAAGSSRRRAAREEGAAGYAPDGRVEYAGADY